MMKQAVSLLLAVLLVLLCSFSYADKARSIATQEEENWHIIHLRQHIGSTALHGTGNYLKVRSQARMNASVLGHLEQKDTFELLEIQNGLALIKVLTASPTSPNSWAGLTGWVDCRYIDCGCTDEVYRMPEGDTGWKKAYCDYILEQGYDIGDDYHYALVYVDEDDVPELAIMALDDDWDGSYVLTYRDGEMDVLHGGGLLSYIPRQNSLCFHFGRQGAYYINRFAIHDGQFAMTEWGAYGSSNEEDDSLCTAYEEGKYKGFFWKAKDGDWFFVDEWQGEGDEVFGEEIPLETGLDFSNDVFIDYFGSSSWNDFTGILAENGDTGWKKAYYDYICSSDMTGWKFAFIFVDQDNIPEIAVDSGCIADGGAVLTYYQGSVDMMYLGGAALSYIPYANRLDNCEGHADTYYDNIYSIQEGKWVRIGIGVYGTQLDEWDDYSEDFYWSEKEQEWIWPFYRWNDEMTDYDGYCRNLKTVYDTSKALYPFEINPGEPWDVFQKRLMN